MADVGPAFESRQVCPEVGAGNVPQVEVPASLFLALLPRTCKEELPPVNMGGLSILKCASCTGTEDTPAAAMQRGLDPRSFPTCHCQILCVPV